MSKLQDIDFKVVGVTFKNDDGTSRQENIAKMVASRKTGIVPHVSLEREPSNKFDKNAIKVMSLYGQVGYVAKEFAAIMAPMMDGGRKFTAKVKEVDVYEGTAYCHITVNEV